MRTVDAAAEVMRESMRETVKRHSLWHLVQSALMIVAGVLALNFSSGIVGGTRMLPGLGYDHQRDFARHQPHRCAQRSEFLD